MAGERIRSGWATGSDGRYGETQESSTGQEPLERGRAGGRQAIGRELRGLGYEAGAQRLSPRSDEARIGAQLAAVPGTARPAAETFRRGTATPARDVPYRATMERAFQIDLGGVRAHAGRETNEALGQLGAQAAIMGDRMLLPENPSPRLVAHEVAHRAQLRNEQDAPLLAKSILSGRHDAAEVEADAVADGAARGERVTVRERPRAEIQRSPISWLIKKGAKKAAVKAIKAYVRKHIKNRLRKIAKDGTAKKLLKEADEILGILDDPWWVTAIEMVPVLGDVFGAARFAKQIKQVWSRTRSLRRRSDEAVAAYRKRRLRSLNSLQKRAEEHRRKLRDYLKDPDKFDNKGFLRGAPDAQTRQRIIDGRRRHLESEIQNFEKQMREIRRELKDL